MSRLFWNFCIGIYVFLTYIFIYLSFYTLACVAIVGVLFFFILKLIQDSQRNAKLEYEIKPGEIWVLKDQEDNPFVFKRVRVEVLDFKINGKGEGWVEYRFLFTSGSEKEYKKSAAFLYCYSRDDTYTKPQQDINVL